MNENLIDQATTLKLLEMQSTQMGNAERLYVLIGEDYKYVPELKWWLHWNGRYWETQDDSAMMLALGNAARALTRAIRLLPNNGDRMEMLRRQQVCDNLLKVERGSENKSVLDFLAGLAAVKHTAFDGNPFLLNAQNGTLNLLTSELQPHNKTDYLTKICAVAYNPKRAEETASASLWEETVNTILPDASVRHWMQKFIGYCLTGSTEEEKFVIAYGPGGSGKGTFFETIGAALSEYKDVLPVDTLLTTNIYTGGNGPSPELAKLRGKRYVLSSESNRCRHLDEAKIKLLTGGDTLTARHLGTEPISFAPTFKLILQTNYLPSISDAMDKGIRRRLVVVPFNANIENRDKKLKQKLLRKENLEACLAWCVEGAKLWQQEGLDDTPGVLAEAANRFYQENDLLQEWLDERTEPSLGGMKFRKALEDFNEWLQRGGYRPWQQKCFAEAMKLHGREKTRWGQGYVYSGLRLRSE